MSPDGAHISAPGAAPLVIRLGAQQASDVILDTGRPLVEQVARRCRAEEGIRFAEMMFGLCPCAHVAAYLQAVEAIYGLTLSKIQRRARALMVLSESLAATVWRHALTWAELAGQAPDMARLKAARTAAKQYQKDLFAGDWRAIGGVDPKRDTLGDRTLSQLITLTRESVKSSLISLEQCPVHMMHSRPQTMIKTSGKAVSHLQAETLLDHFKAHVDRAYHLMDMVADLRDGGDPDDTIQTARGPLSHHVTLDDGRIKHWRTKAPTDLNFAPDGPAARELTGITDPRLARWIIAAYDPCRPYIFERSVSNA